MQIHAITCVQEEKKRTRFYVEGGIAVVQCAMNEYKPEKSHWCERHKAKAMLIAMLSK